MADKNLVTMTTSAELPIDIPIDYDFDAESIDWDDVGEFLSEGTGSEDGPELSSASTTTSSTKRRSKAKAAKSLAIKSTKFRRESTVVLKRLAFPSFDKSDGLVYFACTFARLINNGDLRQIQHIMKAHLAKGCDVTMSRDGSFCMQLSRFVALMTITEITAPDVFVCMRSTKVEGNQIKALLYYKYTDVPEVYSYSDRFVSDPVLKYIFTGKRKTVLSRNMGLNKMSAAQQDAVLAVLDKNEPVQVYGTIEMELTIDDLTKKITKFQYIGELSSICHNDITYKTICSSEDRLVC